MNSPTEFLVEIRRSVQDLEERMDETTKKLEVAKTCIEIYGTLVFRHRKLLLEIGNRVAAPYFVNVIELGTGDMALYVRPDHCGGQDYLAIYGRFTTPGGSLACSQNRLVEVVSKADRVIVNTDLLIPGLAAVVNSMTYLSDLLQQHDQQCDTAWVNIKAQVAALP